MIRESREVRELMLELARTARSSARVQELAAQIDYHELSSGLRRQRLLRLLGSRLISDARGAVPDEFANEVRAELAVEGERIRGMELMTWSLLQELEASDVPAVAIKGPTLSLRVHGNAALRRSDDIDILVQARDMATAIATFERIGGCRPRVGDELPLLHHHVNFPDSAPVELHWRIYWFDTSYTEALMTRTERRDGLRVLAPADELVSLLLFHARDGFVGLRLPADIDAWWESLRTEDAVRQAREIAWDHPYLTQAIVSAATSVQQVLGVDIASQLDLPLTRRARAAVELTDWAMQRSATETRVALNLVDGLIAPIRGLPSYLRRTLLPRLEGPKLVRPIRRAAHGVALSSRESVALASLIRHASSRHRSQPLLGVSSTPTRR